MKPVDLKLLQVLADLLKRDDCGFAAGVVREAIAEIEWHRSPKSLLAQMEFAADLKAEKKDSP